MGNDHRDAFELYAVFSNNKKNMNSMSVYTIDPLSDPRWAELVQKHPRSCVFHTAGWLEALHRTYGYTPVVFTTSPPDTELANGLLFCGVSTWLTGHRLVSLPFSDHCSPLVESSEELTYILDTISSDLAKNKWQYIEMRPANSDLAPFANFQPSETFYFHSLDLRPNLDQLFRQFHKDCIQRKIRRAEREHLVYEAGNSESLLRMFYQLLLTTRRKQGLPPQPIQWYRNLIACLGDKLKIHVASKDRVPVASILTLSHKRVLVYKYGCSDPAFNQLGGTPLLFWQAIQEAKNSQVCELDMGRSDCDNPGLVTFKDRWGAARSMLTYSRYPSRPARTPSRSWQANIAKNIVSHMPDSLLTAAGRVLYKHVG
jgi:hypothetical protein